MRTVKSLHSGYAQVLRLTITNVAIAVVGANYEVTVTTTERHRLAVGDTVRINGLLATLAAGAPINKDWLNGGANGANSNLQAVTTIVDTVNFKFLVPKTGLDQPTTFTYTNAACQKVLPTEQYEPFAKVHPDSGALLVESAGIDAGEYGSDVYIDTAGHTGNWGWVKCITATVFHANSVSNVNGLAGPTYPAGYEFVGMFTTLQLVSGSVQAMRNGKGFDKTANPIAT